MKLTLLIPTYNEADMLERCIVSAMGVFDEVLVVDSFSTDETVNIAKKLGARVIQRVYENSASQKNWAIPQASFSWVLLLDADEWMTNPFFASNRGHCHVIKVFGSIDPITSWANGFDSVASKGTRSLDSLIEITAGMKTNTSIRKSEARAALAH